MITPEEWNALTQTLELSPGMEERLDAACRLGGSGMPGTAAVLVRALQREEDPVVREAIIGSLLLCDTEELVSELVHFFKSNNPTHRSVALEILTYKVEDRVIQLFEELLLDSDRDLRVLTVHALGRSKYAGSIDLLRKVVLQDGDINVVGTALEYLGEVGLPEDAALVEDCIKRFRHPYVEFVARRALERLGTALKCQGVSHSANLAPRGMRQVL